MYIDKIYSFTLNEFKYGRETYGSLIELLP